MERADIGVPEIAATSSHYNLYCHRDALDEAKGYLPGPYLLIKQVHLPYVDRDLEQQLVNVACCGGRVWKIIDGAQISTFQKSSPISWQEVNGEEGLLIPSLSHSHIHLDKCFILDQCDQLISGDFAEALRITTKAKAQFTREPEDLYRRGYRLIRESVECGVTSMRTHVEVDTTVKFTCLDVGLRLSKEWEDVCEIQVAAFAQEPLFMSKHDSDPGDNYTLLKDAAHSEGVAVVGSTPYVEPTISQSKQNIDLILDLADSIQCHADFHLDYNLDPASEPLIYYVIQQMHKRRWTKSTINTSGVIRTVTIGHATRLGLLTPIQWQDLKEEMAELPISIVGLPQSDVYMMGRHNHGGTLPVVQLARDHGVDISMSVNNVQNAFTPQGSVDPLGLCTLGVGIFQAGTPEDCRTLLRAVTRTSKRAIGLPDVASSLIPSQGDPADFVILHESHSAHQAVLSPSYHRTTIRAGRVVAGRKSTAWNILTKRSRPTPPTWSWYVRPKWSYLLFLPFFVWKWTKSKVEIQ